MADVKTEEVTAKAATLKPEPEYVPTVAVIKTLIDKDKRIKKISVCVTYRCLNLINRKEKYKMFSKITTVKNIIKEREKILDIENITEPLAYDVFLDMIKLKEEDFKETDEPIQPNESINLKNYIYQYKTILLAPPENQRIE